MTRTAHRKTPTVLVLGGSGHLGRDVVEQLLAKNMNVRVLSRAPGHDKRVQWVQGDLATGASLEEAFFDVSHVVHAATNSPIARSGSIRLRDLWRTPLDVEIDGTQRVIEQAQRSEIEHFLFVSIVGLEDSRLPYSRAKLAGERLVRESTLPWSVVRATPFFYLVERMLEGLHKWPVWPLPSAPFQPVDTRDVADYIVGHLIGMERGDLLPIGGPHVTSYVDMARSHLRVRGLNRRIVELRIPDGWARQCGIVAADGVHGRRGWDQWLAEQVRGLS